jgi:two-component system sensor histidine kinase RpfC
MVAVAFAIFYACGAVFLFPISPSILGPFDRLMGALAISLGVSAALHIISFLPAPVSKLSSFLGFFADYAILVAVNAAAPGLMLPSLALLPLLAIVNGIRFGARVMLASMGVGLLILAGSTQVPFYLNNGTIIFLILLLALAVPLWMYFLVSRLQVETQNAKLASQAKSRFVAHIGHELRTPLNTIVALSDVLIRPGEPMPTEQIELLRDNARLLRASVSDVLNFSLIEKGEVVLRNEAVHVRSAIRRSIGAFKHAAKAKDLQLTASIPDTVPSYIFSDPARLDQVLANLIGNAIKYTEVGSVLVSVTHDPKDDLIFIHVIDTGIGLPSDATTALFDPFVQGSAGPSRRYDGVGLGLSIVRGITFAMGGWATLNPRKDGQGTIARVTLPANTDRVPARVDQSAELDALFAEHQRLVPQKRILVVEDTHSNRYVLCQFLLRAGHRPVEAQSAAEAITLLGSSTFDMLITDLHMPHQSGIELISFVRSSGFDYATVPMLVVTADATTEAAALAIEEGALGVLTKPIDPAKLLHAVQWQVSEP